MGDIGRLKTNWKGSAQVRGNAADRSPESVAMVLRNSRILQGYDLDEVAHTLNIRAVHLEALEDGRFADLPPLVYAQGFVAAYADFLGEDRTELVSRFRDEASGVPTPLKLPTVPQFNLNTQPDAAERRIPSAAVVIAGLVLMAIVYGLWQASMPDRREDVLAVPPLPSRFAEEAVAPPPVLASAPTQVYAVPAGQAAAQPQGYQGAGSITLKAYGEVRLQFRSQNGQRFASLALHNGQSYTLPPNWRSLQLEADTLSGLSIVLDGRIVPQKNSTGRASYLLTLDPQHLLDGTAVLN